MLRRVFPGWAGGGKPERERLLAFVLLIGTGVIYPLVFSLTKIATDAGTPPFGFVFWQIFIAGLAVLVIGALRGGLPPITWPHVRAYGALASIGIAAPVSLLAYVSAHLPAGLVTLVVVLAPFLTYALALLIKLERRNLFSLLGIALGLGGVLVVVLPRLSLPTPEMVGWVLIACLAPVFFAAANISAALLRPPATGSLAMAGGMLAVTALIVELIGLGTGQSYAFPGPASVGWWATLGTSAINAAFYVAFFEIVRLAGPVFFAQINYLVVLCGFGWGALLFGERHSAFIWIAAALMLGGLVLHTLGLRRARRAAQAEPTTAAPGLGS
jgi:drug/metabolite transporter (DMT)-like permease